MRVLLAALLLASCAPAQAPRRVPASQWIAVDPGAVEMMDQKANRR